METPTATLTSEEKSTIDRLRPLPVPPWVKAGFQVTSAVAPGAAARLAQRLFFTPPRAPLRAEERAVLAAGEPFSLRLNGGRAGEEAIGRVIGWAWGEGPAVLLVHGWGGHAGQMTPLVAPLLAAGFRVVAVDLPGHGESDGRVSSLVHFSRAIARAAALWRPLSGLVAHSFGAAASTYAMAQGLAVERAVFFAPPARFDTFWARFRRAVGVPDGVWRRMVRDAEAWLAVSFAEIAPVDLAPAMTAPLLVLHDAGDREMPFAEGVELAERWPGATLSRTEGLGHLRILRDPRSLDAAARFLSAVRA